jgi:hypothetical protein
MCKYAVNYYQINCSLCFLLILIKMDTPDQVSLLQGRSLRKTLLEHTVQDQIEISI